MRTLLVLVAWHGVLGGCADAAASGGSIPALSVVSRADTVTVTLPGVLPGAEVFLFAGSAGEGPGLCHPTLAVCLGLREPVALLGAVQVGPDGLARIEVRAPRGAGPVWVQAAARLGSRRTLTAVARVDLPGGPPRDRHGRGVGGAVAADDAGGGGAGAVPAAGRARADASARRER